MTHTVDLRLSDFEVWNSLNDLKDYSKITDADANGQITDGFPFVSRCKYLSASHAAAGTAGIVFSDVCP